MCKIWFLAPLFFDQQPFRIMASSSSKTSAVSTSDLATLISNGKCHEVVLHRYTEKGLLDIPDKDGRTPLMIACLRGLEDIVRFLLANGANPNSCCLKEGNTPMHYACTIEELKGENFLRKCLPWKWTTTKIAIIELLLSSGATDRENLNGWTALCVAAFYKLGRILDFFFYRDDAKIPLEVKIRVNEILGVSEVLCNLCLRFDIEYAFYLFSEAIGLRQGATLPKAQVETSELAACFLRMSLQECHTAEEIELIRESEVGVVVHAFLVGERLFPMKLKQKYLYYPSLAIFGCDLMLKLEMLEEGRLVLSCAIGFEHRGDLKLGSVVENLARLCRSFRKKDDGPNDQCMYLQYVQDLLCEYESVLNHVHIDSLSDHSDSLMDSFAEILFNEAFFCSTIDILRSTLQTIQRSMRVIRWRICVENPDKYHELSSVTYKVMSFLDAELMDSLLDDRHVYPRSSLLRVMFVLRKILFCEDITSCRDRENGDTLLHTLLYLTVSGHERQEHFIDLAWVFVRHGCPIDAVNNDGKTAKDILLRYMDEDNESDHRFLAVVSPPTTVLSLEEIAIRQILRKNISYLGEIPTCLQGVIEGGLKDADLEIANDESDNDEERE